MIVEGAAIAAATAEEIAFFAIDTNATIDAFNIAMSIIEEEYKKIISPEQPDGDKPSQARTVQYG
jgi:hypothetical protein